MMNHSRYANIIEINESDQLDEEYRNRFIGKKFVFRGHRKCNYDLLTSLDRLRNQVNKKYWTELEPFLLEEFQRRYNNYSPRIINSENKMEWWAWMQHHGAPTRLLDWTYSFYVATYFALENIDEQEPSAVWAIDHSWLWEQFEYKNKGKKILSVLKNKDKHLEEEQHFRLFDDQMSVLRLSPTLLNERQSVQQGCFLVPGNVTKTFIDNLIKFADSPEKLREHCYKLVIANRVDVRQEILSNIYRMNISRASLFPGLDGFSFSLKTTTFAMPSLIEKGK